MNTHIILTSIVIVILAFDLNSVRAALLIGQEIAGRAGARNIQDAVSPPLGAALGLVAQLSFLACMIAGLFIHGWLIGIFFIMGSFIAVGIVKKLFPSPGGVFFRNMIIRSMMNRYANYEKRGDIIRARAMKDLLQRLNYPVPNTLKS